jgi:hypothetical protein
VLKENHWQWTDSTFAFFGAKQYTCKEKQVIFFIIFVSNNEIV